MVISTNYGGYCELLAVGKICPLSLFENYYNNILYATFCVIKTPVKKSRPTGNINNGHFKCVLPINSTLPKKGP